MSEEQLNKEAEEYADRLFGEKARYSSDIDGFLYGRSINAFKAGYRSRGKEVEELKDLVWRAIACGDHVFSLELNQIKRELKARLRGDD